MCFRHEHEVQERWRHNTVSEKGHVTREKTVKETKD